MPTVATLTKVAALLDFVGGIFPRYVAAGGGGDGVAVNGVTVDQLESGKPKRETSVIRAAARATLQAAETLTLVVKVQEGAASDMSDAADVTGATTTITLTGPGGGGTVEDGAEFEVSVKGLKRYWRVVATPTFSAGGVDTGQYNVDMVMSGLSTMPTT